MFPESSSGFHKDAGCRGRLALQGSGGTGGGGGGGGLTVAGQVLVLHIGAGGPTGARGSFERSRGEMSGVVYRMVPSATRNQLTLRGETRGEGGGGGANAHAEQTRRHRRRQGQRTVRVKDDLHRFRTDAVGGEATQNLERHRLQPTPVHRTCARDGKLDGALWHGVEVAVLVAAGRGRCVSVFIDKNRRYIGKSQSKRPPKRTQRQPHQNLPAPVET
jgi:hypothetical protein